MWVDGVVGGLIRGYGESGTGQIFVLLDKLKKSRRSRSWLTLSRARALSFRSLVVGRSRCGDEVGDGNFGVDGYSSAFGLSDRWALGGLRGERSGRKNVVPQGH